MSALFSPMTLRGMTVQNRIVVSPMCQYMAVDGAANTWHLVHAGGLALSGAGMLCLEATGVEPAGRITPGCLALCDDATEAALRCVVEAVRAYSHVKLALQIAHAGRKGSSRVPWEGGAQIPIAEGGWVTPAPSAVPQKEGEEAPAAMDAAAMDRVRSGFAECARRAARLGFDALEVHGAHGYLLHQFLSPVANRRTDSYGGALDNRMRFPLEVFDAVRAAFPDERPVGVKISATDWVEGGWDIEQSVTFSRELKKRGADWVTASSGGASPLQKIPVGPNYQVPFAERIKRDAGLPTIAVGLITAPPQAEQIVAGGLADLVALARGMLYDPRWGWHAAAQLGATVEAPPPYWRAPPHEHKDLFGRTVYGGR